jgi:hypothetical protein
LHHAGWKCFPLPKVSHFNREPFGNSLEADMGGIRGTGEGEEKRESKREMWKM